MQWPLTMQPPGKLVLPIQHKSGVYKSLVSLTPNACPNALTTCVTRAVTASGHWRSVDIFFASLVASSEKGEAIRMPVNFVLPTACSVAAVNCRTCKYREREAHVIQTA